MTVPSGITYSPVAMAELHFVLTGGLGRSGQLG
jgi:hypothetical protein